jgi:membrane-bound lytic murein transglycosylase B
VVHYDLRCHGTAPVKKLDGRNSGDRVKFQTGEPFWLSPCHDAQYPENVEEKYAIAVDRDPVLRPAFHSPAGAATRGGDFSAFLSAMSREAAAAGISRTVIDSAFAGLTPDGAALAFDRRQRATFRKSFEDYAATRVVPARINRARQLMQRHAALLARIEREFGVPASLLMAIWTLESDNGSGDMGTLPVVRTLATLAHDCRRTQGELLARELIGAYAGEIGQTQFLPSSYIKYGIDYDGNGHVDPRHSGPDVLASTANLLKIHPCYEV